MFRDRYKEACKRRGSQGARRGLDGNGSDPGREVEFSCLLPTEAPFSILALKLIAIIRGFAKTVKVAFSQLFPVNDWRDDLSKAGIAQ